MSRLWPHPPCRHAIFAFQRYWKSASRWSLQNPDLFTLQALPPLQQRNWHQLRPAHVRRFAGASIPYDHLLLPFSATYARVVVGAIKGRLTAGRLFRTDTRIYLCIQTGGPQRHSQPS